jgi:hypothetical protein
MYTDFVCVCVCVNRALYTDCVYEKWELPLCSDIVVLVQSSDLFQAKGSQLLGDGVFSLKHLSPHHCTAQSRYFESSSKITGEMNCVHVAMS